MKLALALAATGALVAASAAVSADDGIPLPSKRTPTPEEDLAALRSQDASLVKTEVVIEDRLHELKSVGLRGALGGEHDPLGRLVWEIFTKKVWTRLQGELAAVTSADSFVKGQEAAYQKEIDDRLAAERAAAEAARKKAEAEAAARAEQAALQGRIERAIANAANAWKPNGIVNRNTGDHSWDMWCLALAARAWETALGHAFPPIEQDTAWHAYQGCLNAGLIHTGGTPPRGALVFWQSGADGHVAISNGDGTVVSNYNRHDAPTGINPAAPLDMEGPPVGWVDPKDIK